MENLETSCSEGTNTVSIANTQSNFNLTLDTEANKKIELLLIKSKKKILHFNRYYLSSFIILVIDFFMTVFYSTLFAQFFNITFFALFVTFAIYSASKVKKGFNLINFQMKKDIMVLLVFNAVVAGFLIFDLTYILASRILSELNCVVSQSDCQITVKYFYECIVAFFIFTLINSSMVFIFFIKFNKLRRNLNETLLHNSVDYFKPKELSIDKDRESKTTDLEKEQQ